jgi:uncharacterized protein (TIGR03435 family)
MRIALFAAILLIVVLPGLAQNSVAPLPCAMGERVGFDVVSVRPSVTKRRGMTYRTTTDGFTSTGSLRRLILTAFGLRDFQLEGGPDWLTDATWEIAGKVDVPVADLSKLDAAGLKAWKDERSQKLQALLMDRFQLKCHMVYKQLPTYDLVLAKSGAKLVDTKEATRRNAIDGEDEGLRMRTVGRGVDMAHLASELTGDVGRIVTDRTGLTGNYDFTMNWTSDDMSGSGGAEPSASSGPSIFTALQEELGLRLVATRGPVPVLVIDSLERPSEN